MLEGLTVPLPTLFDSAGAIDPARNSRFTRRLCDTGVDHLFVLGSIGEFASIRESERAELLESVIESLSRMAGAWVGCGAPSTAQAVAYAVEAEEMGAEALVAVPPYYLHPTEEAIDRYYRAIRAATKIPLLAYNIPSLVGYALSPALVHRLGVEKVLDGIKDTAGRLESVTSFLEGAPKGFAVLPGDDALAAPAIAAGAAGAIMGTGTIVPKLAKELVAEARAGNASRASELQGIVDELVAVIRLGPFPSTDKFLAARLREAEVGYRSPYDPLSPAEERRVVEGLGAITDRLAPFL